jgi:transposase
MSKSTKKRIKKQGISVFPILHLNAAGIDVSDTEMMVCVPGDRCEEPIQAFGTFTSDLHAIVDHLRSCRIDTVAMESTGVYWVPLFLILQDQGFDVYLVNAKHVKNVTGRKDDEEDAAWIQRLHSCGLLNRSFQPDNDTRGLRSLVRHRKNLIQNQSSHVNRIEKTLELMNIKLHTVISDILGKSGMAILDAIINKGERDAEVLSQLTHPSIKADRETIIKSLEADWREEHLFELRQYYELYHIYQEKIKNIDVEIEKVLGNKQIVSTGEVVNQEVAKKTHKIRKNEYFFNASYYLKNIIGIDPTEIFGISDTTALEIFSEVGGDMSRFPSSKHFCSWLGLTPNTKISGGKVISSRIMRKKHKAGQAFRIAANSQWRSKNELGNFYRRIKSRSGPGVAVVATARKIATIWYMMQTKQEAFNPIALNEYQKNYKEKKIRQLKYQLEKLRAAS